VGASNPMISRALQESLERIRRKMENIRFKIAVMSGKGGVGKSMVSTNISVAFSLMGFKTAILDSDFHGPSIPKMLGVEGAELVFDNGFKLVETKYGVSVISIGFLLDEKTPVIWRGPMKANALRQFLSDVNWGELDFLVIDLPPGTGDEALSVAQLIPGISGAIIVSIPSDVSRVVVERSVSFARKLDVPVLGIIENMSYFKAPDTGKIYYIFGKGGGRRIAEEMNVPFLGEIPIDPRMATTCDEGIPFIVKYPDAEAAKAIMKIAEEILNTLGVKRP